MGQGIQILLKVKGGEGGAGSSPEEVEGRGSIGLGGCVRVGEGAK